MRVSTDGGGTWVDVAEVRVQIGLYRDEAVTLDVGFSDEGVISALLRDSNDDTLAVLAEEYAEIVDRVIE